MTLSRERRNEIAWMILENQIKKQGIDHFKPNEFRRDVTNRAKEIDVSQEELREFSRVLILPLVEEMLAEPRKGK